MPTATKTGAGNPRVLTVMARQPSERTFSGAEGALIAGIIQLHEESWIRARGTSSVSNWYLSSVTNMPGENEVFCMGFVEFRGAQEGFLVVVMVAEMSDPNLWRLDGVELWNRRSTSVEPMLVPEFHLRRVDHPDGRFSRVDDASTFTHLAFLGKMAKGQLAHRLIALGLSPILFGARGKK